MRPLLAFMMLVFTTLPGMAAEVDMNGQYDETHQENSSFNSPYSSMSNVQINPWGNAHDYYGDGVSCSKPSVNIGLAGGQDPHRAMAYASINIPLGRKDCKKMANTRKLTMEYQLHQLKTEQYKADVLFAGKMAEMCLEISKHLKIVAENPLYKECGQYMAKNGGLEDRVQVLEGAAHNPNETFLIND